MKKIFLSVLLIVSLFNIGISTTRVFAQTAGATAGETTTSTSTTGDDAASVQLENPIPSITTIGGFVEILLNIVLTIGIPIVAFFIILSGFRFVTARGNPEALGEAKRMLLYSLIGGALLLGAWVLAEAIQNTVNLITTP